MSLELPYRINVVNPAADLDERKGPHANRQDALDATSGTREIGLTVQIMENGKPVEYIFETGVADEDLVKKKVGGNYTAGDNIDIDANDKISVTGLATVATTGDYNHLINAPDLSILANVIHEDSLEDFPNPGSNNSVYIARDTGYMYRWNGVDNYIQLTDQTALWGNIGGTLDNQIDLNNKFATKADKTTTITGTGYLEGGGSLAANRSIDLKQSVKDDIEEGTTAYEWGDHSAEGYEKEERKVNNLDNPNNYEYPTTEAVQFQIDMIMDYIAVRPNYTSPSATISGTNNITVERGSDVNTIPLTLNFTKGDAGNATGYSIERKEGSGAYIEIATTQSTNESENDVINVTSYRGKVSYGQGACKNNNINREDCRGRIEAGTVTTSNTITITPRLRIFFGSVDSQPTNSGEIRALSGKAWENVGSVTLVPSTTKYNFVVAMPSNKSIVNVTDTANLNADLTNQYVLVNGNINVEDAGGHVHQYKLYMMTVTRFYERANHVITIL